MKIKRQGEEGNSGHVVQLTFALCREHDSKTLWYKNHNYNPEASKFAFSVKKMVGFLAVQSKAHILIIYLPYFPKGGGGGGGEGVGRRPGVTAPYKKIRW